MSDAMQQARLQDLALAFSLGELDQQDQEELYQALRDDSQGAWLAQELWTQLQLRGELRSLLNHDLATLIEERLDGEEPGERGLLNNVLQAIGLRRDGLQKLQPAGTRPLRIAPPLALLLALGLLVWLLWPQTLLQVEMVQGPVFIEGEALQVEQGLRNGIIDVHPEAQLLLGWQTGARAHVWGPAQCSASPAHFALHQGRTRLSTVDEPLRIGLPGCGLRIDPQSRVEIQQQEQPLIAVHAGQVAVVSGTRQAGTLLGPGQWSDGAHVGPWRSYQTDWPQAELQQSRHWQLQLTARLEPDSQIQITIGRQVIRLLPQALALADGRRFPLAGAPRHLRALELRNTPLGLQLAVDGQVLTSLPSSAPPAPPRPIGAARLQACALHNGPVPLPE